VKKFTNKPMQSSKDPLRNAQPGQELVALCAGVLPIWARHLATSRAQSEVAVTEMLQAFADIGPHIHRAERQSLQITEALSQSDGGVTGLTLACERVLTPIINSEELTAASRLALQQVLTMVGQAVNALEEIAKPFTHETQMVAAQVERMYVGFQYQDRISQMMALLEGDIARLQATLGADATPPSLVAWLEHLESQYAMAEQRKVHPNSGDGATGAGDSNETTFF
jgi:ABC-type transporter Mla subunit MlaD